MHLGIDVDDVLYPWFHKAHTACEQAGITNGITPTTWECYKDYGVTLQQWLAVMETATLDGTLYTGEPTPGAIDALHELHQAGHTIHIVTARGYFAHGDLIRQHTIEWLRDHKVPHDALTFTKDKTSLRLDAAIDDSERNVHALTKAGINTWIMDAPHNQHVPHQRVHTMSEFAHIILTGLAA